MAWTKKIWGILFLVLSITAIAPHNAWAEDAKSDYADDEDDYHQRATTFLRKKGLNDLAKTVEIYERSIEELKKTGKINTVIVCGTNSCDLKTSKCFVCNKEHGDRTQIDQQTGQWSETITKSTEYKCLAKDTDISTLNYNNDDIVYTVHQKIDHQKCHEITKNELSGNSSVTYENYHAYSDIKDKDCFSNSSKEKFCLIVEEDSVSVNYGKENGFKNCEVLPVKLYNQKKCFFCPLFKVLVTAAEDMTRVSFEKLAGAFQTLIVLGLAIWIAVQTLTHVSSLTKQDAPKFLGNILRQSFKFLIAFFLLRYTAQIYNYAVMPILLAGMDFGNELLVGVDQAIKATEEDINATYLAGLYPALHSYISHIQASIAFMQAIGSSLICVGGHLMLGRGGASLSFENIGDGFQMIIQGILLAVFGLLLSLAFGFYLIDAVVQLGIVGALMPFLIASWPFKITAKYAKTGCDIVLNSFFVFVFVGLVITVNLKLVDAALQNTVSSSETVADNELGGLYPIFDAINTQDIDRLKDLTDITFIGFLILVVCCLFGFKLSNQSSSLAGKFSGGAINGIGSSIGGMAASAVVSTAKKVTAPIRNAVGSRVNTAMTKVTNGLIDAPGNLGRWAKNKISGGKGGSGGSGSSGGGGSSGGSGGSSGGSGGGTPTVSQN